jgi:NitT/TauT family transport system substrate-binding protein
VVQRLGDRSEVEDNRLSRRTLLGRAGGLGVTAMLAPVLVACGESSEGGSPAKSKGRKTVKITLPSNVTLVLWAVDYLSEDLGYYKEEGLTIKRVPFGGGPLAMQGLLSGAGTGTLQTPGEMLTAIAKQQKLKALMAHTNSIAATLVVSKDFAAKIGVSASDSTQAKAAALASVKGARYAISAPGSQTDGLTRMALKQFGLRPDADARIVPLQSAANYLPALENNRIDAFISGDSPVPEQAQVKFDAVPLLSISNGDIHGAERMAGQTFAARASDVESDPDLFARLVRANVRAMKVIVETPDKARDTLRKTRFAKVEEEIWPLMWRNSLPIWKSPYVSSDALGAWIENGLIAGQSDPAKLNLDGAIESRFVDEAVKAVGWNAPKV